MVCIDSCNFYEIPNVFTPNGDDINEKLIAKTSGLVERIDFKLFNRNGLLLFKTDNPKIEWDGTYKGRIVFPLGFISTNAKCSKEEFPVWSSSISQDLYMYLRKKVQN